MKLCTVRFKLFLAFLAGQLSLPTNLGKQLVNQLCLLVRALGVSKLNRLRVLVGQRHNAILLKRRGGSL